MTRNHRGRRFRVGRLFGVPVRIHFSWLVLGAVLSACLAVIYSRSGIEVGVWGAFGLGLLTTTLFGVSVVSHELAHAATAKRHGREVSGISLEFAGGRTVLGDGPEAAGIEFRIALAGPVVTFVLLLVLLGLPASGWLPPAGALVAEHLALMNGLLLAFNLLPALPLDGGRLLRAALWKIWKAPGAASRAAIASGRALSLLLITLGVLGFFLGGTGEPQFLVGIWFLFVGIYLRRASGEVARQLWLGEALADLQAGHMLDYRVRAVQRNASIHEIEQHQEDFPEIPVVEEDRLLGSVTPENIRNHPENRRDAATAADLMQPGLLEQSLAPGAAALRAYALLSSGRRAVAIVEEGNLIGVVTMDALKRRLALRLSENDAEAS